MYSYGDSGTELSVEEYRSNPIDEQIKTVIILFLLIK